MGWGSCAQAPQHAKVTAPCVLWLPQVTYTEVAGDTGNRALDDITAGRIPNVHAWRNEVRGTTATSQTACASVWTLSKQAMPLHHQGVLHVHAVA